jgi:hypothetical protein
MVPPPLRDVPTTSNISHFGNVLPAVVLKFAYLSCSTVVKREEEYLDKKCQKASEFVH